MNCAGIPTIYRPLQPMRTKGQQRLFRLSEHRVIVIHVIIVPDGLEIVTGEGVGVQHPPEHLRNEAAVRGVALFLGCDPKRTKDRTSGFRLGPALLRLPNRNAPVHVPVPPSDAEWNRSEEIFL